LAENFSRGGLLRCRRTEVLKADEAVSGKQVLLFDYVEKNGI